MALNQGPGRNIDFCLITTGINIDPDHGGQAQAFYEHIKNIIQKRADIHFEKPDARELREQDVSIYLKRYNMKRRPVFQALFGLVKHNNGWTEESLTQAIENAKFSHSFFPENGEISIDWQISRENGFKLFRNVNFSGVDVWEEVETFYYSNRLPQPMEGEPEDTWLVQNQGNLEIWRKFNFRWINLQNYLDSLSPTGELVISDSDPGNQINRWWLDISGLAIRQYNGNNWGSNLNFTIQNTAPSFPNLDDVWIKYKQGVFYPRQWTGSEWKRTKFSSFVVLDKDTNSEFIGEEDNNNFVINCGDQALTGGPVAQTSGGNTLEIRKDGSVVNLIAECLNFKGPDFTVYNQPGCVNVEHNTFTTLPEQNTRPPTYSNAGRIYTKDISGTPELFYLDDESNEIQLTNKGSTNQNIFLDLTTTNAVAGQTNFTAPSNAKDIIAMKINGLDTAFFTFNNPPTVVYDPVSAGYDVQSGDKITLIYYA